MLPFKKRYTPHNKGKKGYTNSGYFKKGGHRGKEFKKGQVPWNKGKTGVYSEETLKKMSGFKKGQVPWNKGKKPSEEIIQKRLATMKNRFPDGLSSWNKGKTGVYSEETLKKMSALKKGLVPWNKGKKGAQTAWNKGKKGVQTAWNKGKKPSEETRKKLSESGKKLFANGYVHPMTGRKHSEHTREIIRKKRLHQVFPPKDTIIEKILQEGLGKRKIPFRTHVPLIGQPDIFIEPNICVMADSDWFHGYIYMNGLDCSNYKSQNNEFFEKKIQKDKKITQSLTEQGYNVLRFWEHEIKENPKKCIQEIIKIIKESKEKRI